MRLTITSLMELGVIVVVPAGNIGKGSDTSVLDTTSEVRHPPAMWAEDGFPLIVASSVSQSFSLTPDSKYGPQTCVWGVGEWCVVANLDSYTYRSGTSYGKLSNQGTLETIANILSRWTSFRAPRVFPVTGPMPILITRLRGPPCQRILQNWCWRISSWTSEPPSHVEPNGWPPNP